MIEPTATAAPCTRCPTYPLAIVTGFVPNVLSSRMRTASPGIVTRAIMRTVTFVIGVTPRPFCDVAQAVIHVPDGARCARSSSVKLSTTARITAAIEAKKRLIIVSSEQYLRARDRSGNPLTA